MRLAGTIGLCVVSLIVACGGSGDSTTGSTSPSGGSAGAIAAGSGGKSAGAGGTSAGSGGTSAGSGGTSAGSGGTSAGAGGTSAGAGGASAGAGGASAGAGGASAGAGGTSAGAGGASAGAGGTSAGSGGTSAGAGGSSAGSGGSSAGSAGAAQAQAECKVDQDCALQADCCACAGVPSPGASCALACALDRCAPLKLTAKCAAGRCTTSAICDQKQATCKSLPQACPKGQTVTVDPQTGCWGPCINVDECESVPTCQTCTDAGQLCIEYTAKLKQPLHCQPLPAPCTSPTCECVGPAICDSVFSSCGANGDTLTCQCPTCK